EVTARAMTVATLAGSVMIGLAIQSLVFDDVRDASPCWRRHAAGGAGVLLEPGTPAGPGTAAAAVLKKLAHVAAYQPAPICSRAGEHHRFGPSSGPRSL